MYIHVINQTLQSFKPITMKKLLYLLAPVIISAILLVSCNKGKTAAAKTDTTALIYKASISSSWAISDSPKNVQATLQSYKDWEDNKLSNAPAYFSDTVSWNFSDGSKHKMRRDSMVKTLQKIRDSLSSSKIDMISIVSLHSTDKNSDWVAVWYKQTDTYKTGKVDSSLFNDVNHIKNGKVDYWSSFRQVLKKAQ